MVRHSSFSVLPQLIIFPPADSCLFLFGFDLKCLALGAEACGLGAHMVGGVLHHVDEPWHLSADNNHEILILIGTTF